MFGIIGINSISQIVLQIAKNKFSNTTIVYVDDNLQKLNQSYNGIKVVSDCNGWEEHIIIKPTKQNFMSIALGEKNLPKRKELFHRFNQYNNVHFPVIKHESCIVSELAIIEDGNILSFNAIVGHNTTVKFNSVIWSGAIIEHDCNIGESCYIAPGVSISGFVTVGDCTLIGTGAVVLPEISIGKNCLIGAGAVVTKDIPDNSIVVGVPAKIIRSCN